LDYHHQVVPKHVQINIVHYFDIDEILLIKETIGIHQSLISFNDISVRISSLNLNQLEYLSNNAKKVTLYFDEVELLNEI
jgi:hypothetical protein